MESEVTTAVVAGLNWNSIFTALTPFIVVGIGWWQNQKLEGIRKQVQLQMVSAEKRLEVHQKAFALWGTLKSRLRDGDLEAVIQDCNDFWYENSLYLDQEVSTEFVKAYKNARLYRSSWEEGRTNLRDRAAISQELNRSFYKVIRLGTVIRAAVNLPPLIDEDEKQRVLQEHDRRLKSLYGISKPS